MIKYFELVLILLLTTILVICIPFSQSWQTSHCDCDPVTNNELCDPICEGTCAAPRLCPPWLQGQWKSAKNWELTVVGATCWFSWFSLLLVFYQQVFFKAYINNTVCRKSYIETMYTMSERQCIK